MRNLIIVLACFFIVQACASNKTTISGKLDDISAGTKLTLVPGGTHTAEDPIAEIVTTADGFVFESVDIDAPRLLYIRSEGVRGNLALMVAPGDKVTISGTFANPVITGATLQEEYVEKYVKPRGALDQTYHDNHQKYGDIIKKMSEARSANDREAIAKINESEEWQGNVQAEMNLFKSLDEMVDKAISDNADTYWAPLLLLVNTAYLTTENEKHYDMFSEEAKNSFYGKKVAEEIFGITGTAPVFTANDSKGVEHSLKSLLKGDNYLLVDFWASWCGPCRRFVPTLKELAAKYADKGLTVISISTDKDHAAWLKAVEEEQMPWLNLLDESKIGDAYGVTSIPSIFLIDPKGELVFGKQSGQSVVEKLEKVFGN